MFWSPGSQVCCETYPTLQLFSSVKSSVTPKVRVPHRQASRICVPSIEKAGERRRKHQPGTPVFPVAIARDRRTTSMMPKRLPKPWCAEHGADLAREFDLAIGLMDQRDAWINPAMGRHRVLRVPGCIQHLDTRAQPQDLIGERWTVESAAEDHIGEQQVECA